MKTVIKRSAVLAVAVLMLAMSVLVPVNKASAAVTYNNTIAAYLSADVDQGGNLNVSMTAYGKEGKTTRIEVSLTVERRFMFVIWVPVDLGTENNVWTDYTTQYYYSHLFSTHLSSNGTYRVTVVYTVSGTGGPDDVITKTSTVTY